MTVSHSDVLATAAARAGTSSQDHARFARHLEALPAHQAARINPFAFAEEAGIGAETALDLFVHGAKLGLFDLEWGMVCPLCGGIINSVAELDRVAEDTLHCSMCNRDTDSVLDDTVEVSFSFMPAGTDLNLHKDFATYQYYYTSSSYPHRKAWGEYHRRHTVADVKLAPGEEQTLTVPLTPAEGYRLLCLDTHAGLELALTDGADPAAAVTLRPAGFDRDEIAVPPADTALSITNATEHPAWCRVLRRQTDEIAAIVGAPWEFGPRLTGKHLLNNQAFRDCFDLHELAPDLKLKLRSLTLLFTDLKGSTALYDREGDLAAYRLVQDHFQALKQVVRDHGGAVIKTMGDAVMAAFPSGNNGTAAAIAMMTAMQRVTGDRTDDVGLKVGLHTGPALAINGGQTVDYFGQTVNIAARVQGLADAGDICLTGALNDEADVPDLLDRAGSQGQLERAQLKGVAAEEKIYRYRAAA